MSTAITLIMLALFLPPALVVWFFSVCIIIFVYKAWKDSI